MIAPIFSRLGVSTLLRKTLRLAALTSMLGSCLVYANHSAFTKLDHKGDKLPSSALKWSCVKDRSTGLTWEKKETSGLQNKDFVSTWSNASAFVNIVNAQKLCDLKKWRLPRKDELKAAGRETSGSSQLNPNFFPNTENYWYWTDSKVSSLGQDAWIVMSQFGFIQSKPISEKHHIRLVHD